MDQHNQTWINKYTIFFFKGMEAGETSLDIFTDLFLPCDLLSSHLLVCNLVHVCQMFENHINWALFMFCLEFWDIITLFDLCWLKKNVCLQMSALEKSSVTNSYRFFSIQGGHLEATFVTWSPILKCFPNFVLHRSKHKSFIADPVSPSRTVNN